MAYYGNIQEIPEPTIENNCINGKCSNCGECCSDMLPLTEVELHKIKKFAKDNRLKEHRHAAPYSNAIAADFTCPFRNEQKARCDVYPVRPLICRSFICQKSLEVASKDRDLITESRKIYSLRNEVFGNPENIDYINIQILRHAFK